MGLEETINVTVSVNDTNIVTSSIGIQGPAGRDATGNFSTTDLLYTSGIQTVSGLKTFRSGLAVNYISGGNGYVGLIDFDGVISNDWSRRDLYDGQGIQSSSYGIRVLRDGIQNYSVEWGNRFLRSSNQEYVMDWDNRILSGNWKKDNNQILVANDIPTGLSGYNIGISSINLVPKGALYTTQVIDEDGDTEMYYWVTGLVSGKTYFLNSDEAGSEGIDIGFEGNSRVPGIVRALDTSGRIIPDFLDYDFSDSIVHLSIQEATPSYYGDIGYFEGLIANNISGTFYGNGSNILNIDLRFQNGYGNLVKAGDRLNTLASGGVENFITSRDTNNQSTLSILRYGPSGWADINFFTACSSCQENDGILHFAIGVGANTGVFPYGQPYFESYLGINPIYYVGAGQIYGGIEANTHDWVWYNPNLTSYQNQTSANEGLRFSFNNSTMQVAGNITGKRNIYISQNISGGNVYAATGMFISGVSVTTGGPYYPASNPNNYITGINTGNFITNTQTGNFYPKTGNPSAFITPSQTGIFFVNNNYRAGTVSIGNLSTSQLVTFTSSLSSNGYAVGLTFDSTLASTVSASATSKTISGFTLTLSAGIAGGINMDYLAMIYN